MVREKWLEKHHTIQTVAAQVKSVSETCGPIQTGALIFRFPWQL